MCKYKLEVINNRKENNNNNQFIYVFLSLHMCNCMYVVFHLCELEIFVFYTFK